MVISMNKVFLEVFAHGEPGSVDTDDSALDLAEMRNSIIQSIASIPGIHVIKDEFLGWDDDYQMQIAKFALDCEDSLTEMDEALLELSSEYDIDLSVYDFSNGLHQKYSQGDYDTGSISQDPEDYIEMIEYQQSDIAAIPAYNDWLRS